MPGWNVHVEVGKRMARRLKLDGREREEFLLGNLLPDINNGYLNKRVGVKRTHRQTHWAFDEKSSENFYKEYWGRILAREAIFLGYLLHLYTDGYFNYSFYREFDRDGERKKLDGEEKHRIKQHDFWVYDTKYKENELVVSDRARAVKVANQIKWVELRAEDILEVEEVLRDDYYIKAKEGKPYKFFTEAGLDKVMEEVLAGYQGKYLEGGVERGQKVKEVAEGDLGESDA